MVASALLTAASCSGVGVHAPKYRDHVDARHHCTCGNGRPGADSLPDLLHGPLPGIASTPPPEPARRVLIRLQARTHIGLLAGAARPATITASASGRAD